MSSRRRNSTGSTTGNVDAARVAASRAAAKLGVSNSRTSGDGGRRTSKTGLESMSDAERAKEMNRRRPSIDAYRKVHTSSQKIAGTFESNRPRRSLNERLSLDERREARFKIQQRVMVGGAIEQARVREQQLQAKSNSNLGLDRNEAKRQKNPYAVIEKRKQGKQSIERQDNYLKTRYRTYKNQRRMKMRRYLCSCGKRRLEPIIFSEKNRNEAKAAQTVFELNLSQTDLQILKDSFHVVDFDFSGDIDFKEFLYLTSSEDNCFSKCLFDFADIDSSGAIDFAEFVHILSTFCVQDAFSLGTFCHKVFDTQKRGQVDEMDYRTVGLKLGKHIWKHLPQVFSEILQKYDKNNDGVLSEVEWQAFCRDYPAVMQPIFDLQNCLKDSTLGAWRWVKINRFVATRQKLEKYRKENDGDLPSPSVIQILEYIFLGKKPYEVHMKKFFSDEAKAAEQNAQESKKKLFPKKIHVVTDVADSESPNFVD